MKKVKFKYNWGIIFGLFLILIGVALLSYDYFREKKMAVFENKNIALFESETPRDVNSNEELETEVENPDEIEDGSSTIDDPSNNNQEGTNGGSNNKGDSNNSSGPSANISYVGILEIPKINLKKGFLDMDSPYNNVDKNVTVIQTSTYPDVENGNLILAAHTGNSYVSFFTRLHELQIGDFAYITYKQKKYTYQLVDIYTQPKVGTISIYRDINKTTLTLVTCTKGNLTTQTIFILELTNVE